MRTIAHKGQILLVDDDKGIRQIISFYLTKNNYDVDEAPNGLKAYTMMGKKEYDLIITDYMMPGLDGKGLLKHIKELDDDLPVIFITAYGDDKLKHELLEQGLFDYMSKPIVLKTLLKRVEEGIAQYNSIRGK